jgi:hypothetical protein
MLYFQSDLQKWFCNELYYCLAHKRLVAALNEETVIMYRGLEGSSQDKSPYLPG